MIVGNLLVGLITYEYSLWDLSSELGGHITNDLILSFLFFPPAMLLFLSHYPVSKHMLKKYIYLIRWALLFTLIEGVELVFDNVNYEHGWDIWKSAFVNLGMFPVLVLHQTRPLFAYGLFFLEIVLLITIVDIPISSLK